MRLYQNIFSKAMSGDRDGVMDRLQFELTPKEDYIQYLHVIGEEDYIQHIYQFFS